MNCKTIYCYHSLSNFRSLAFIRILETLFSARWHPFRLWLNTPQVDTATVLLSDAVLCCLVIFHCSGSIVYSERFSQNIGVAWFFIQIKSFVRAAALPFPTHFWHRYQ